MDNCWKVTGKIEPSQLTKARIKLHYAIQFIAATGAALAEPLPDYSHTSLSWSPDLEVFVGTMIQAKTPFQIALDPFRLNSIILDKQGDTIAALSLPQKTMVEGLIWLKEKISKLGVNAGNIAFLSYPPDDFPDDALAHGATFDTSEESPRHELINYYANTHQILAEIVTKTKEASPIHIWPHHFDMATLISLSGTKNGEPMTVGIGLSPGDKSYGEPYWYVSPYPYPETDNLPMLEGNGFWHTQHWVGAVLTASQLTIPKEGYTEETTAETQKQQVETFLNSALLASMSLLNAQ